MAVHVSREDEEPSGDPASFIASCDADTLEAIEDLVERPAGFGLTFSDALSTAQLHCLHDPTADTSETWEAWVAAMQVGAAMFAAAVVEQGTVECRIAHEMRTIPAIGVRHFTDAGSWVTAFWLAVVCRDQKRMTQLAEVPVDLLRASGAVYDEYIYHWVDTLQTYWTERPGLGEKFTEAFQGTDPEVLRIADRELMLKLLYPPLELFLHFLQRNEQEFNAALVRAVQSHKEYWTKDEDRRQSTDGAVALGPLAMACLAHDVGMSIGVKSEYLPEHLLRRSWLGEFET
ncbi:immunity 49 family protein [Streptomyces sp. NPDC058319]|uniref:immunity 49 family protein n=1 Tax=unclassified Streptomyces TaxID=2593676 RepID=UPI0036EA47A3